jgi:hypothetical protein
MSANFGFGIGSRFPPMNGSTVDSDGGSSLSAVNNTDLPYHGSGNISTEYVASLQLRHSVFWTIVISIAYAAVFAVGIAGNAIVVSFVKLKRQMRTVTNLFILNLAIADLIVLIFCLLPNLLANIFVRKYNLFIQYIS